MENISMDQIPILNILQIQENWAGRSFIMNLHVYLLLLAQAKMQKTATNRWRDFG